MAQSMRPISTITDQGNFTGPSAHGSVDGAAPDTGDYWNGLDNKTNMLEVLLTDLSGTPPADGTCTVDVYQAECDTNVAPASGGGSPTYSIEVYEGAVLRASRAGITASESAFTQDNALTFNASIITDWSDVRVRFTSIGSGGSPSSKRGVAVSFVEVSTPDGGAPADNLLAEAIESASEVTAPSIGQTHAITADDIESASEVSVPAVGQIHALLANSIESASEVSVPTATSSATDALLAEDIESASEVSNPAVGQTHALLAEDIESASELSVPAVGGGDNDSYGLRSGMTARSINFGI